jgi:cytoskeletal protein RodZ
MSGLPKSGQKGFVQWKVRSTPSLGEVFRIRREQMRLDTRTVARKINIKEIYLIAIERGRFDKLPADVYAKGFIKSYASFLKLNPEDALAMFDRERQIQKNITKNNQPHLPQRQIRNPLLSVTPRMLMMSFVVMIMAGSIWYLWSQFASLAEPPLLSIDQPGDNIIISDASLIVSGATEEGSSVYINGQAVEVGDRGFFQEEVSLQNGLNVLSFVARNKFGSEISVTREVIADIPEERRITSSQPLQLEEVDQDTPDVRLVVHVDNGATRISVKTDGETVFDGTMLPGSSTIFNAERQISLTTSDASNTRVEFNGNTINDLGETGAIRDLVFTDTLEVRQRDRVVQKF